MKVYVQNGSDEVETTINSLKKVRPNIGNKVLIKPNLTMPFEPNLAIRTSPKVIEGIIRYLQEIGIKDIIIGEGVGGIKNMSEVFEITGYKELSKKYNVPLINLNNDKQIKLKIKGGYYLKEIIIAKSVLDRQVINVPKMKTHRLAGITLAMKNMMGAILPYNKKRILHPLYEEYILRASKEKRTLTQKEFNEIQNEFFKRLIDFYSVYKPFLNIIDGFIARGGDGLHSNCGKNKKMNCVILSENVPAIDFVSSYLMKIDLKNLYLKYLKNFYLSKIKIISNVNLEKIRKKFRPVYLTEKIVAH